VVALLSGNWGEHAHCLVALAHRPAELQPGSEAGSALGRVPALVKLQRQQHRVSPLIRPERMVASGIYDLCVEREATGASEREREDQHTAAPTAAIAPRVHDLTLTPEAVLRLQRSAGNAATRRLIERQSAAVLQRSEEPEHVAKLTAPVERPLQRSIFGDIWNGIKRVASAAWSGIKTFGSALWEGAKSLGSQVVDWVEKAGSAVWTAIKWFGQKSWDVIKIIGTHAWEGLSRLPMLAWTFLTNLPVRLWRFVIDSWGAVTSVADWVWKAMKSVAGKAWDGVVGALKWLGEGFGGALEWLQTGLAGAGDWFVDFIRAPSWDKLRDGLLGTLGWLGDGLTGLAKWGIRGVIGASMWATSGITALGAWMWDTICAGFWQGLDLVTDFLSLVGAGEGLQFLWGIFARMRPLTDEEIAASKEVHPAGMIPYEKVRVDDQSLLTKINGGRAVTTMHIIHAPKRFALDVVVHELTHVAQYEKVGAKYLPEAGHAQATEGYDYVGKGHKYANLEEARRKGARFADFNREQQAQMVEDYYVVTTCAATPASGATDGSEPADPAKPDRHAEVCAAPHTTPLATAADLEPFIADMRTGAF
jgi:hypothetical protein